MDFTLSKYMFLLKTLKTFGYRFLTYTEYLKSPAVQQVIVMRHDVDLLPSNSLRTAQIEYKLGIKGTYYFRIVPESWDERIIKEIADLGHEIGYHYESLTTCNGNIKAAYEDFVCNLEKLRLIVPVSTICMHGSPRSPYDSKDIWKQCSYKNLGIIGEPYLNTDFSEIFYLTDTGRRWDGYKVSVRDKIDGYQEQWEKQGLTFHSTDGIINAIKRQTLPEKIMITVHPQRWNPMGITWIKELVLQNMKNAVKGIIIKKYK